MYDERPGFYEEKLFSMHQISIFEILLGRVQKKRMVVRRRVYQRPIKLKFVSGETHYYKGTSYLLNVIYRNGFPKIVVQGDGHIDLYVREGSTTEQREKVMTEWYRKQLKQELPSLIAKWEEVIGVKIKEYNVKQMKTRWGTCNVSARRIWINLELAKKPEHCLEYLVVHEMVHLLERKHNAHFKSQMDKFIPQWRTYRKELKL